jgi:hypothetical protein
VRRLLLDPLALPAWNPPSTQSGAPRNRCRDSGTRSACGPASADRWSTPGSVPTASTSPGMCPGSARRAHGRSSRTAPARSLTTSSSAPARSQRPYVTPTKGSPCSVCSASHNNSGLTAAPCGTAARSMNPCRPTNRTGSRKMVFIGTTEPPRWADQGLAHASRVPTGNGVRARVRRPRGDGLSWSHRWTAIPQVDRLRRVRRCPQAKASPRSTGNCQVVPSTRPGPGFTTSCSSGDRYRDVASLTRWRCIPGGAQRDVVM